MSWFAIQKTRFKTKKKLLNRVFLCSLGMPLKAVTWRSAWCLRISHNTKVVTAVNNWWAGKPLGFRFPHPRRGQGPRFYEKPSTSETKSSKQKYWWNLGRNTESARGCEQAASPKGIRRQASGVCLGTHTYLLSICLLSRLPLLSLKCVGYCEEEQSDIPKSLLLICRFSADIRFIPLRMLARKS